MLFFFSHQFIWLQVCLWWSLNCLYLKWAWVFPLSPWASQLPVTLHWQLHQWQVLPPSGPPPSEVFVAPCHRLGIVSPQLVMSCKVVRLSKCLAAGVGWHDKGECYRYRWEVCRRSCGSCGNIICPHLAESSLAHVSVQVSCVRREWKGHSMYIGCLYVGVCIELLVWWLCEVWQKRCLSLF